MFSPRDCLLELKTRDTTLNWLALRVKQSNFFIFLFVRSYWTIIYICYRLRWPLRYKCWRNDDRGHFERDTYFSFRDMSPGLQSSNRYPSAIPHKFRVYNSNHLILHTFLGCAIFIGGCATKNAVWVHWSGGVSFIAVFSRIEKVCFIQAFSFALLIKNPLNASFQKYEHIRARLGYGQIAFSRIVLRNLFFCEKIHEFA